MRQTKAGNNGGSDLIKDFKMCKNMILITQGYKFSLDGFWS